MQLESDTFDILDENVKLFKNLNEMKSSILNKNMISSELTGKKVIVLFGSTGSSKSTMANALCNNIECIMPG